MTGQDSPPLGDDRPAAAGLQTVETQTLDLIADRAGLATAGRDLAVAIA